MRVSIRFHEMMGDFARTTFWLFLSVIANIAPVIAVSGTAQVGNSGIETCGDKVRVGDGVFVGIGRTLGIMANEGDEVWRSITLTPMGVNNCPLDSPNESSIEKRIWYIPTKEGVKVKFAEVAISAKGLPK